MSIIESLNHAGFDSGDNIEIKWVDSETITAQTVDNILGDVDGILIPGGFGSRGIEGKIEACRYARENDIPYLGICLGMQIAVIEFARNVLNLTDANSGEFDNSAKHLVIDIMEQQANITKKGGTMRLGAYPCKIESGTLLEKLYNNNLISERHRHRYEFNNLYREQMTKSGLVISGLSPDGQLVEAIEIRNNRFFVGVQFHPEFKSRPNKPHPLFKGLITAAKQRKTN